MGVSAVNSTYCLYFLLIESHWLFSTDEGRQELARSAGFARLIVVTLSRDHVYKGLDQVKTELSAKVMELAPPGVTDDRQVVHSLEFEAPIDIGKFTKL